MHTCTITHTLCFTERQFPRSCFHDLSSTVCLISLKSEQVPHKHIAHNVTLTILSEHQVYYLSYLVGTHILTLIFSYRLKSCLRLIHTGSTSGKKEITVFSGTAVSFWDSIRSRKCKFKSFLKLGLKKFRI